MAKRIVEWSLDYEGCDHAQYFRGVGVSGTQWDEVYLGAGPTPLDAARDAVENAAMATLGDDTTLVILNSAWEEFTLDPNPIEEDSEDWYHYAALYVRYAEDAP